MWLLILQQTAVDVRVLATRSWYVISGRFCKNANILEIYNTSHPPTYIHVGTNILEWYNQLCKIIRWEMTVNNIVKFHNRSGRILYISKYLLLLLRKSKMNVCRRHPQSYFLSVIRINVHILGYGTRTIHTCSPVGIREPGHCTAICRGHQGVPFKHGAEATATYTTSSLFNLSR